MRKLMIVSVAALMALSVPALAQTYRSDVRQHRQERRIERGVRSGELTRREAHRLRRQEARIHRMERRSRRMNNGYIDPRTERHINRIENRISHEIYRKKHNRRHY